MTIDKRNVEDVHLADGGRDSVLNAIFGPGRESARIGASVPEDLDFLVDRVGRQLVQRDCKQAVSEAERFDALSASKR